MNRLGVESIILAATLAEVRRTLGGESEAFVKAVGVRIGAACIAPVSDDLATVQAWMSEIWATLDLGEARLSAEGRNLRIIHQLPAASLERRQWSDMVPGVVEGIYSDWMTRLDGRGRLSRVQGGGDRLEFLYAA